MANGERKPISEVEVGEYVYATDPETGETGAREVIATLPHTDQLLTLRTSSGVIVTTEDHRYWNATDQEWQESQHLDEGDRLLTADGDVVTVEGLDWSTVHTAAAYDLDVADLDSFYVGAGEEAVLVHNCGSASPSHFKLTERPSGRASTRQIDELADSMRTNGWQGDPVEVFHINGDDFVINGHHRVEAARKVGIDVQYRHISEAELRQYGYSGPDDVIWAWANR